MSHYKDKETESREGGHLSRATLQVRGRRWPKVQSRHLLLSCPGQVWMPMSARVERGWAESLVQVSQRIGKGGQRYCGRSRAWCPPGGLIGLRRPTVRGSRMAFPALACQDGPSLDELSLFSPSTQLVLFPSHGALESWPSSLQSLFCSQFLLSLQGSEQGSGGSRSEQPWDGTALVVPWHFPFSSLLSQPWLWVSPLSCPCLAAMALLLVTKRNFHTSAWSTPGP